MLLEKYIIKHSLALLISGLCSLALRAQNTLPDFQSADIQITPDPNTETLTGTVAYQFETFSGLDRVVLDSHNMEFERVFLNVKPVTYRRDNGQ